MAVAKTGITQIIEVVNLTREKVVANGQTVTEARVEATHAISQARGVNFRTIEDKYIRGLDNTINGNVGLKGAENFDRVLEDTLRNVNTRLRDVLISRTNDVNLKNSIIALV
jgi:hypothetical protein